MSVLSIKMPIWKSLETYVMILVFNCVQTNELELVLNISHNAFDEKSYIISDELISDVLLWTPIYGRAKAKRPARTYIQQLCEVTGCSPEDLPEAMNDREKWRERVREIHAGGTTWWCWWYTFPLKIPYHCLNLYFVHFKFGNVNSFQLVLWP